LRAIPDVQLIAEKLRNTWTHNTGLADNAVSQEAQTAQTDRAIMQVSPT
jgi:hypothetical protein